MKIKNIFPLLILLTALISCKKKDTGSPGKTEIWLEYQAFQPSQLIVTKGTTVKFTNKDNADHTATEYNHLFNSGTLHTGDTYSYTFNTAGVYYFYCNYHSSNSAEQGAIKVQ